MSASRRALPDHDVELVILERRIKDFFQSRLQPVHFVDEQDLLVANVGQDGRQVALDLQRRPRGLLKRHAQFVGDDGRQRRLAQPGRPIEQHMIQRLSARLRRLDRHRQILFDLGLPDEFHQPLRAQLQLKGGIVLDRRRRNQPFFRSSRSDEECS